MLRKLAVLLVLGAILLTACGSDDGAATDAGAAAETGAGADGGAAAETGAGGDEGVGAIDVARCAELAQAMAAAGAAAVPGAAGAADLESSVEQLRAFAEAAPEEIRDDMQTVAEGYARMAEAFQEAGYDPSSGQPPTAEQIAALTAATEQLDSEEFQAAAERVSAYFEAECGT